LPFVNASAEDIEKGLRKDAAAIQGWMEKRLAPKAASGKLLERCR
jgi:hypothetical protein